MSKKKEQQVIEKLCTIATVDVVNISNVSADEWNRLIEAAEILVNENNERREEI